MSATEKKIDPSGGVVHCLASREDGEVKEVKMGSQRGGKKVLNKGRKMWVCMCREIRRKGDKLLNERNH